MARTPKGKGRDDEAQIDPRGGDAILKRMLQAKPKTHDEMVAERRGPPPKKQGKVKRK